jgi:hypothetical protein
MRREVFADRLAAGEEEELVRVVPLIFPQGLRLVIPLEFTRAGRAKINRHIDMSY